MDILDQRLKKLDDHAAEQGYYKAVREKVLRDGPSKENTIARVHSKVQYKTVRLRCAATGSRGNATFGRWPPVKSGELLPQFPSPLQATRSIQVKVALKSQTVNLPCPCSYCSWPPGGGGTASLQVVPGQDGQDCLGVLPPTGATEQSRCLPRYPRWCSLLRLSLQYIQNWIHSALASSKGTLALISKRLSVFSLNLTYFESWLNRAWYPKWPL